MVPKLLALGFYSVTAVLALGYEGQEDHFRSRNLQTGSNIEFIDATAGTPLSAGQQDGSPLENADGGTPADATALAVGTVGSLAEYEMYFSAPDTTGATGFTLNFVGQLNGAAWSVDMFDFEGGSRTWVSVGDLSGITSGAWATKNVDFTATTTNFIDPAPAEILIRVYATGSESGFLDYASITALGGSVAPAPAPTSSAPTSSAPTSPSPSPGPSITGATAVYVERVVGAAILPAQASAGPLANAEGSATSATEDSIEFASSSAGAAEYEIYFGAPAAVSGDFTITVTAQLGSGATASNWKVDMYDFNGANTWASAGSLTGVSAGSWGTSTLTLASSTPTNFVETSVNEILIRVYTEGATGVESLFVDQITIASGSSSPVPAPTPVTAPTAPTTTPTAPTTTPTAPTTTPTAPVAAPAPATGGVRGTPEFVDRIAGATLQAGQENAAGLVSAEGTGDAATSVEFASVATGDAEYEIYLSAPVPITGAVTILVTVQLGAGAAGGNWKIDLFDFIVANTWAPVGDLAGASAGAFSTVDLVLPTTTPTNYVAPGVSQMLVRVYTSGATGIESIVVDALSITAGTSVTSPTPTAPTATPTAPTAIPTAPVAAPAPVVAPAAPVAAPVAPTEVQMDLVPCIFSIATPIKDVGNVASAYLFNEYFKGFWAATQNVVVAPSGTLDLVNADGSGKCSVIFVGITPTAAQKIELQDYARLFKVRVVYFDIADTILDAEVQTRLGMQSNFDEPSVGAPRVKLVATQTNSIVPPSMVTDPTIANIFNRPVVQLSVQPGVAIDAQYAAADGTVIPGTLGDNVAIATYVGTDGLEEMHVFIGLAWFDMGSWAWGHYIAEWATRGIFQGERRFYLGAVVDDLFLTTGVWIYDPPNFEGPLERLSGADLDKFFAAEQAFNAQYNAEVKTEHAFNGIGILDKVESVWRSVEGTDADIALLPKGQNPSPPEGINQQLEPNWLSTAFNPAAGSTGMQADYDAGLFSSDDLLARVQAGLSNFYWQSHTLTHLARDNLGVNDCDIEDGGNAQMAVLIGLFGSDNYNWRSMTSPGITGLFNGNCLRSGDLNLMTCYPGDNTFDGVQTDVSLVNEQNQYLNIFTTVATNGYDGMTIVPRWATNVYFNCVTGECLVDENEKIRRDVCGCADLNPANAQGTCSNCPDGTQSFNDLASSDLDAGPLEKLYQVEEQTTTRYILSGRRDKYMFHQANVVSTTWASSGNLAVNPVPSGNPSLLEYWYERVLAQMAQFINTSVFPIKTLKFDNLCQNFREHGDLDTSGAIVKITKDPAGAITSMSLDSASGVPVPVTVPTASAAAISTGALTPISTETYGADTTYTFAVGDVAAPNLSAPDVSELAPIPQATAAASLVTATDAPIDSDQAAIADEAEQENQEDANDQGFVIENNGNDATTGGTRA